MKARRPPQAVVIAGPNGAGKTSAAPELLRDTIGVDAFVNADVIAEGLSGFSPQSAAFEAGRVMLKRLRELAASRADFGFESTLAGRSVGTLFRQMAAAGYELHVVYLWLPSVDLAIARVRERVSAGGHDVAEGDVRRRFGRSLVNFYKLYRPLATSWQVYDGSAVAGRPMIASGKGQGEPVVVDSVRWRDIHRQLAGAR